MPDYFWEWYENKGYDEVLKIEYCFENKAFLVGCCIEYLTEKGQKITKIQDCNNFKEILNYLQTGVAWTR
ncbi:hypothetical protein [uncultured Clostridium sp.]|uniref:hypothetical protein n=1 Tax=uncultured Clostridium sp. TaxID=59620 RepID=UPI003217CF70